MTTDNTRITLIKRIQNSPDEHSWEEFNAAYFPYIMAILNRSGIDRNKAEDICQEIFLSVWKNIENLDYDPDKCRFRTWLITICRNKIISEFRKKKLETVEMQEQQVADVSSVLDEIIEREWKIYIADKALKKVTQLFAENVIQVYMDFQKGRTTKDIAAEQGIAENTVHVYSGRVKKQITREIIFLINDLDG